MHSKSRSLVIVVGAVNAVKVELQKSSSDSNRCCTTDSSSSGGSHIANVLRYFTHLNAI